MIDLLSISQVLLREAGYTVRLSTIQKDTLICFEDSAVIGFCAKFTSPEELIKKWSSYESEIVFRFADSFRAAGEKAWNVYCIFITESQASEAHRREIGWIEENLDRTRKLAASGISSREDLIRVLLPILPIQYQPVLLDSDVTIRLKRRIADIAPNAVEVALNEDVSAADIVNLLGVRQ